MTGYRRALVTGASSGIGEEFARQLAAAGTSLVLVARRADRLEALAGELRRPGVDVEVLPADLASEGGLDAVALRLAAGDVDLLVNNAGFGVAGPVAEADPDRLAALVAVNVGAVVRLTRAALPSMVAGGRGAVVNVSSLAGAHPLPLTATYSASKSFVTTFSEAVAQEVRRSGVVVQALCPGFTRTEFQETSGYTAEVVPGPFWHVPGPVVATSLAALTAGRPRTVVVPGAVYKVARFLARYVPRAVSMPLVAWAQGARKR